MHPNNLSKIERPQSGPMNAMLGHKFKMLDGAGYILPVDYMGTEQCVIEAARVSYGEGTTQKRDGNGLLRYLMRHQHTSPFEMCELKIEVKLPIYVARQWVRHRTASLNEYSARYSVLAREFYIPEPHQLLKQSTSNKQGSSSQVVDCAGQIADQMRLHAEDTFDFYEQLLADDMARETARINLPMSTMTKWVWKSNLHNLLNFIRLRNDSHAQREIREYAGCLAQIVGEWVPNIMGAFYDYRVNSHTFSYQEMCVLRDLLKNIPQSEENVRRMLKAVRLSDRESNSFIEATKLGDEYATVAP